MTVNNSHNVSIDQENINQIIKVQSLIRRYLVRRKYSFGKSMIRYKTKSPRKSIDFDTCLLKVENTKNGEARHIPLTPTAILTLKNITKENELVFNYTADAIRQAWERFKNKYGFEYLRFHDLRHEAISQLFELGLSVPEAAAISGHRTVSQLFRYAHSDTLILREKMKRVLI